MIELRPVQTDDEPFLAQVYASTREEELAATGWNEAQKQAFLQMQFHAQHTHYQTHYPDAAFDVILVDGQPAGRLYVDRSEREVRIIDIALLAEYRSRGIGSHLIRDILAEAAQAEKPVTIHVERFNPALHLYERLGFRCIEDKGVYLLMEWRPGAAR